jgi:Cu+-exporting ATPase
MFLTILTSCIRTIEDSLSELSPRPTNLEVSIVSQTVTLHLPDGLSLSDVTDALDEAGFDVLLERPPPVASSSTRTRLSLVHKASKLSAFFSKRQKHADQCMLCGADSGAHEHAQRTRTLELPYVAPTLQSSLAPVDLTAPPSPRHSFEGEKGVAPGHGGTVDPVPLLDVSLSIGGMTCASCANSISRALAELDGVSDVVISVLGHSGTCKVTSRAVADDVVSAIEDCGFEAEIVDIHDAPATKATALKVVPAAANTLSTDGPQRLELSIGGMTCASCSNAITDALNGMPGVSDVHVNLLGNSGSVTVESYAIAAKVVEAIEDIGYEVRKS